MSKNKEENAILSDFFVLIDKPKTGTLIKK